MPQRVLIRGEVLKSPLIRGGARRAEGLDFKLRGVASGDGEFQLIIRS